MKHVETGLKIKKINKFTFDINQLHHSPGISLFILRPLLPLLSRNCITCSKHSVAIVNNNNNVTDNNLHDFITHIDDHDDSVDILLMILKCKNMQIDETLHSLSLGYKCDIIKLE